jgi:putative membrane protein
MSTIFAFLHHLGAFIVVSAVAVEFVLLGQELTLATARLLLATDAVLGISATLVLGIGLLCVFYFDKGPDYYFSSHAFTAKLSVFIAIAVLSAIPTMEFLSRRKAVRAGQTPAPTEKKLRFLRTVVRGELLGVVIILLCAAMARGGFV